MGQRDLAVSILQDITIRSVQDARCAARETSRVIAQLRASPSRFHAYHLHALVAEEGMEQADRVAAAAHAGDQQVGQGAVRDAS